MLSKTLVLAALCSLVFAKPMARKMKVHESREAVPAGFVRSGAADANTELTLRIALVQNNPDGLIDELYAVSTPGSASYGEHLSKEEVSDFSLNQAASNRFVPRQRSSSLPLRRARRPLLSGSRTPALPSRLPLPPETG